MDDSQLIDHFCDTLDATYLKNLSPDAADLMIQLSVVGMKKGQKKYIAKKILYFFGLDQNGQPLPPPKKYPRKHAEDTLSAFSTALTGARVGDIIVGKSNASRGAIMRIHDRPVYPQTKSVARVASYPDLWAHYMVKLGGVPFFAGMTVEEREHWITINQDPSDISIGEAGERVELLQPGTSDFVNKLAEEDLELLLNGNPDDKDGFWTSEEIEAMFPAKPGSKARKHTLIMFRGMWRLATDHKVVKDFDKMTIDVDQGIAMDGSETSEIIYVLDDLTKKYVQKAAKWVRPAGKKAVQEVGFMVSKDTEAITDKMLDGLIAEFGEWSKADIKVVRYAMRKFTGAAYKSLLQKLIRFTAKIVEINGQEYPTELVLLVTVGELVKYPGSFVPDIQRYVTGLESLAKRLAVTIFEDSSLDEKHGLLSMLSGALVAQRIKTWSPTRELLLQWMHYALQALANGHSYDWDWKSAMSQEPYVLDSDNTTLENCSALLDELKSFHSDLAMVRSIADKDAEGELGYIPPPGETMNHPAVMPFIHCVDQHWAPNIVYFFDPDVAREAMKGSPSGAPFKRMLWKIFKEVTGVNPRRSYTYDFDTFEKQPFVKETRKAQQLVMIAKQEEHRQRPKVKGKNHQVTFTLDTGWLAGMVGALEIKGTPLALVTLRSDDPLQLVVIRRPSRDMKDSNLSPKRHEQAVRMAKDILKEGVPLNKTQPPSPLFVGAKAYLVENSDNPDENYYVIETADGESITWDEARELAFSVPFHPKLKYSPAAALIDTGEGIEVDADAALEELVAETSAEVLRRAVMYLSTFRPRLELNRVSRDGGGTYHAVVFEDVGALHFILRLSMLFPAAIRPTEFQPGKFDVPVGPVLWDIVKQIRETIAGTISKKVSSTWNKISIKDTLKRKPWPHQTDALADMQRQHRAGGKGHFIWIPVGLGKSMLVMNYLKWLKEQSQLPKHIIYTLPQSAIKSVLHEIQAFGFEVELLIPLKSIKGKKLPEGVTVTQTCKPKPYTVTMLEHDYLRRCETELANIAPNSIFIIDEVHKALNDTKRTSVALEISNLSREFIAMTGTPVIDSKTYKLIWWLEQVVPFEVNEKNFWVAANGMIAKKASTGVLVDSEEILALFNNDEEVAYTGSVPPALGGLNTSPTSQDWQYATAVSYDACNREMINQTAAILGKGRGVMLVAKDSKHQDVLYDLLLAGTKLKPSQIFVLKGGDSIFLTDEAVKSKEVPDYRVVIVPIQKAEGYTLTHLSAMVASVYPSNNATREQIEGRINRIGQKKKKILYRIVHAGILTRILQHHNDAKSLSMALQSLAEEVK